MNQSGSDLVVPDGVNPKSNERNEVVALNLTAQELETIVARVLARCAEPQAGEAQPLGERCIPIEASARHVHLTAEAVETLFGKGATLTKKRDLSQPGEFLSEQRVKLVTPKGEIENVAVLGPVRPATQVELSLTDCRQLGLKAPVNLSGDLSGAADVYIIGDKGAMHAPQSVIVAKAHIHLRPEDAARLNVSNGERVSVQIESGRSLTFNDIICRVSEKFAPAMHIDYDEANACMLDKNARAKVLEPGEKAVFSAPACTAAPAGKPAEKAAVPVEPQAPAPVCDDKLITEAKARSILNVVSGNTVCFARGTLVTPAAKDIFAQAKKTVEFI